jgi:hypothetical protein
VDLEVRANDIKTMCDQPDCPLASVCYRFMRQAAPFESIRTYNYYFDEASEEGRRYGARCYRFVEILPGDELRR